MSGEDPENWDSEELLEYLDHRLEDVLTGDVADERAHDLIQRIRDAMEKDRLKWCFDHGRPQPGCPGCRDYHEGRP